MVVGDVAMVLRSPSTEHTIMRTILQSLARLAGKDILPKVTKKSHYF